MARDWAAVRAEYIAGAEAADLARKYRIPLSTIKSRASLGRWGDDRNEIATKTQLEMPAAIASAKVDEAAAWVRQTAAEYRAIYADLLQRGRTGKQTKLGWFMGDATEQDLPFLNEAKDARTWISALKDVDDLARRALGIIDLPPAGKGGLADVDASGPAKRFVVVDPGDAAAVKPDPDV